MQVVNQRMRDEPGRSLGVIRYGMRMSGSGSSGGAGEPCKDDGGAVST